MSFIRNLKVWVAQLIKVLSLLFAYSSIVESMRLEVSLASDEKVSETRYSPFLSAILRDAFEMVSAMLKDPRANIAFDERDLFGNTPLILTVKKGNGLVAKLIAEKADCSLRNLKGRNALDYALKSKELSIVDVFLRENARRYALHDNLAKLNPALATDAVAKRAFEESRCIINIVTGWHADIANPHHIIDILWRKASLEGLEGLAAYLISVGVACDKDLGTPAQAVSLKEQKITALLLAVIQGHYDLCALLLINGADPNYMYSGKRMERIIPDPRFYVPSRPTSDIATIDAWIKDDSNEFRGCGTIGSPLHYAAQGDSEILKLLLIRGRVDETDCDGRTPLLIAVIMGLEENVHLLLGKGAHVLQKDNLGFGMLEWAIWRGDHALIKLWFSKKNSAVLNKEDSSVRFTYATDRKEVSARSLTNLREKYRMIITEEQEQNLAEFLEIEKDCFGTYIGNTALSLALWRDDKGIVADLFNRDAKPACEDGEGVLRIAARYGRRALFEYLLQQGLSFPEAKGGWDMLLKASVLSCQDEMVKYILGLIKAVLADYQIDQELLLEAVSAGNKMIVETLVDSGACVLDVKDVKDITSLKFVSAKRGAAQVAACQGHCEILRMLVQKCGLTLKDPYGGSILHLISIRYQDSTTDAQKIREVLDFCIKAMKLDINAKVEGFTPLHVAVWYKYLEVIEPLLERGARNVFTADDKQNPLVLAKHILAEEDDQLEIQKIEEIISLLQRFQEC